jgi:hypothetical protein
MYFPANRANSNTMVQGPYILAQIRALRSSIFNKSSEVQAALAIAARVEQAYDLTRDDLFVPAFDTFSAILEPLGTSVLTGTLREIGYEMFPQYISVLKIPPANVKVALNITKPEDVIRAVCDGFRRSATGSDAGEIVHSTTGSTTTVTDTTFVPCALFMGIFLGAGNLTKLFRHNALIERRCRGNGERACSYDFVF